MKPARVMACSPPVCHYCGLPLGESEPRTEQPQEPRYCCFGCRFAYQVTHSRGEEGQHTYQLTKLGLAIFFTLNVVMLTMVLWSPEIYGGDQADPWSSMFTDLLRYTVAFLAFPVLWLLGLPLWVNAWQGLRHRQIAMDLLMVLGVAAAYVYSLISTLRHEGAVYFEVGCVVLVCVTLGRWLEASGKHRITAALAKLDQLLPTHARRVMGLSESMVPLAEIQAGDRLRLLAGERLPCDGRLTGAAAMVDQQLLTGESTPRRYEPGDVVPAGSLNLETELLLDVTTSAQEGTLGRFVHWVRQALFAKSAYQRLADRATSFFLPGVVVLAIAATAFHGHTRGIEHGIMTGLAVVLIACPCALGIATPLALWSAMGQAVQRQILLRNGDALERLAQVRVAAFDKTGTLTTGAPEIESIHLVDAARESEIWTWTIRLAHRSNHPLARALARRCAEKGVAQASDLGDEDGHLQSVPGQGMRWHARDAGDEVRLGNLAWVCPPDEDIPEALHQAWHRAEELGQPVVWLSRSGRLLALFVFRETVRGDAQTTLDALKQQGLQVVVLTGDHRRRAEVLAQTWDVPVRGELLPTEKVAALNELRDRHGPVAMVGDGLNDAPALASSDVGLAMGCGTDLARDTADVCLLSDRLDRLPWLFDLSRDTVRIVRQNLFWAFIYNVGGLGLASMGWLNPIWASVAMVLSSLFVVMNSMRLRSASHQAAEEIAAETALAEAASGVEEQRAAWKREIEDAMAQARS